MSSKYFRNIRRRKFQIQKGKCILCGGEMVWIDNIKWKELDAIEKLFVCTLEHLRDRRIHGSRIHNVSYLAASHWFCNFIRSQKGELLRAEYRKILDERCIELVKQIKTRRKK